MDNGYNGKILRVNLSKNTISEEKLDELFCRRYLGGAGFITYYLMKELKPGIDPLGLDNKLFFMAGPLTGLSFSGSARHCVGAKSPLTGGYGMPATLGSLLRVRRINQSISGFTKAKQALGMAVTSGGKMLRKPKAPSEPNWVIAVSGWH